MPLTAKRADRLRSSWKRAQPLVWLSLPFVVYLIPLLTGHTWSALGPSTPMVAGVEGYDGRSADVPITVEPYGTGVLYVPFQARLREYMRDGDLPLWNPYQGLGEPFAAQGDGNPFFPFQLLRSAIPYAIANYVTVFEAYLAAVFAYLFLRQLGVSQRAAVLGGAGYALSGALSLHMARPNIADQLCMIPVLFWAALRAMRLRTARAYVVFALIAGLHLIGGFIQIAMISALALVAFCVFYASTSPGQLQARARLLLTVSGVFVLGNGLAAFYLLPQLEAASVTYNKNPELLAFTPMPYANIVAFFFPVAFGPFFNSWIPLGYPRGLNWDNLFAYAGTGLLLTAIVGLVVSRREHTRQRSQLWFFSGAVIFLLLRFISFPAVSGIDLLPVLGRQSPKHSNGLTVFCLAVAAALALDFIRSGRQLHARWMVLLVMIGTASSVLTLIGTAGGLGQIDLTMAKTYVPATAALVVMLLAAVWCARRWDRLPVDDAKTVVVAAVLAELSVYVPLGNGTPELFDDRLALAIVIAIGGLLWALKRRIAAGCTVGAAVAVYTWLVVASPVGLPNQFDLDTPPAFMRWMAQAEGADYRSFGIQPDYSSLSPVKDISTVGPLAPREFERFVHLVSSAGVSGVYDTTSAFALIWNRGYDLANDYPRARPVLDWMAVKYVALDKAYFGQGVRTDDTQLLAAAPDLTIPYEDGFVRIVESPTAEPRAVFSPAVQVQPSQDVILQNFKENPSSILGPLQIEASAAPRLPQDLLDVQSGETQQATITIDRPNEVQLTFDAPSAGLAVLKDSFFPGWQATINGEPTDVIRVNGLVRGVAVPRPGHYTVEFVYAPQSFTFGVWLSAGIALLLMAVGLHAWFAESRHGPRGPRPR